MENLTNETKAQKIAKDNREHYYNADADSIISSEEECYDSAMEMAEWKDEQHKQELIRIYNFVSPYLTPEANNDLKIIIGIC